MSTDAGENDLQNDLQPEELNRFWSGSFRQLAKTPLEASCEEAPGPLPYRRQRITYRSLGGVPIRAYLAISAGVQEGVRLPAVVTTTGYGGRQMGAELGEALRGFAILQIFPRGQGESAELWRVDPACEGDWLSCGAAQPEGYYYQGAYLDIVRGIDYLLTRADIDAARIGVMGTSQGGAIALATGALDPRVAAVAAHVPYMCDMRRNPCFAARRGGDAAFQRTYAYFDPLSLAPLLTAPVLLSAGGRDTTSPAATIQAVFHRLQCIRSMTHYPDLAHTTSPDFHAQAWEWMERHVRRLGR